MQAHLEKSPETAKKPTGNMRGQGSKRDARRDRGRTRERARPRGTELCRRTTGRGEIERQGSTGRGGENQVGRVDNGRPKRRPGRRRGGDAVTEPTTNTRCGEHGGTRRSGRVASRQSNTRGRTTRSPGEGPAPVAKRRSKGRHRAVRVQTATRLFGDRKTAAIRARAEHRTTGNTMPARAETRGSGAAPKRGRRRTHPAEKTRCRRQEPRPDPWRVRTLNGLRHADKCREPGDTRTGPTDRDR